MEPIGLCASVDCATLPIRRVFVAALDDLRLDFFEEEGFEGGEVLVDVAEGVVDFLETGIRSVFGGIILSGFSEEAEVIPAEDDALEAGGSGRGGGRSGGNGGLINGHRAPAVSSRG